MTRSLGFLATALLVAASTQAEPISFSINGYVQGTDPEANGQRWATSIDADTKGQFYREGGGLNGSIWAAESFVVSGDTDPVANLAFTVTNTTGSTIDVIMTVNVPIAPPLASSQVGGTAAFTVSNSNGDASATLANNLAGDPLFLGLIDGAPALDLLEVVSETTSTSSFVTDTEGLPGPTIAGPAATTSIGIEINFSITPGDSVSVTSSFIVEIPEPASLALLSGLGCVALMRRRGLRSAISI